MTTIKRFEVGDTKCFDTGTRDQALLIGCGNGSIISLEFDNERATHAHVHELKGLLGKMRLTAVEVQTEEPGRYAVQRVRRRIRPRPGRWPY